MATNLDDVKAKVVAESDTSGVDDAKQSLEGFGGALKGVGEIAEGIGLERLTEKFLDLGVGIAAMGLKAATGLENTKVAFDYAFGKGSGSMLKNLEDLSQQSVISADSFGVMALKLKNTGEATSKIPSTLKDISNIASGTGTSLEDIGNKADIMGQTLSRALQYGKVSSLLLRPLISANIPIMDSLVNVINREGGAFDESASKQAKSTKAIENAQAKHVELSKKIADANEQFKIANETVMKFGFNHQANQKTLDSHNLQISKLKDSIASYNDELKKNDSILTAASAGPQRVTKQMLMDNAKSYTISAQQLQDAYKELSNTKFSDAAVRQARSFNGTMDQLKKGFTDMMRDILGENEKGDIAKGGVFDHLRIAAADFLKFLKEHKTDIINFGNAIIDQLVPAFEKITNWFTKNKSTLDALLNFVMQLAQFAAGFVTLLATQKGAAAGAGAGALAGTMFGPLGTLAGGFAGAGIGSALGMIPSDTQINQALNHSRTTNINMHNTVHTPSDWSSVSREIAWRTNGQ